MRLFFLESHNTFPYTRRSNRENQLMPKWSFQPCRLWKQSKNIHQLTLLAAYVVFSIVIFLIIDSDKKLRIEELLNQTTANYQLAFQTAYQQYNLISYIIYTGVLGKADVIALYEKIQDADETTRATLRKQLYQTLNKRYKQLKQIANLRQLHFHLKNNESFLRMHRPEKFGDDLSSVRATVAYVNRTHYPIDGFEEGRIFNGFRYVYPIHNDKQHLGSVEISFSALAFSANLIQHHDIYPHFYVSAQVINQKLFEDEKSNYIPSVYDGYYEDREVSQLQDNNPHDFEKIPDEKLLPVILKRVKKERAFTIYLNRDDHFLTLLPLLNPISHKQVAFFEIHSKNPKYHEIIGYFDTLWVLLQILLTLILWIIYLIWSKKQQAETHARFDELTGVYNRRQFNEIFEYEMNQAQRFDKKLSLAIMDIDHFKKFNDRFGHKMGDRVLQEVARTILLRTRKSDTFARWGGEEFVLIMTHTSLKQAEVICDIFRKEVEIGVKNILNEVVTISIGVSQLHPSDTLESLFERCDRALYQAKSNGRNQVVAI